MHTKERDLHRPKHGVIEHQLGEGPVSHRQNLVTLRAHTVSGQHLAAHPARFSLRDSRVRLGEASLLVFVFSEQSSQRNLPCQQRAFETAVEAKKLYLLVLLVTTIRKN